MAVSLDLGAVRATGSATARSFAAWFSGSARGDGETLSETGFWADVDGSAPDAMKIRRRLFLGNAALMHSNRAGANATWLPDATTGANWAPRDAQLAVMQDRGIIAISGASRASDANDLAAAAPIGVAGFVLNDTATVGRAAWALYGDVQHDPTVASDQASSYGIELAVKNKGADYTDHPYALTYGAKGIWLAGGGDEAYGGVNANPCNAAIVILKNFTTWNRGIVFEADSLTGTDGVTGTAVAVSMARGQALRWYWAGGNVGASIRSDVDAASSAVSQIFDDNAVLWTGNGGTRMLQINWVTSAVNFVNITAAIANAGPIIAAAGTDSNIDLALTPKGTGNVRFGTLTASGDAAVSGYITIKDAGGTARKLAVIT